MFVLWVIMLMMIPAAAFSNTHGEEEVNVDVNDIIFGHIGDSYDWHITEWKGEPVAIYLPVILYSKSSGWHVFSSRKIHGGHNHDGFQMGDGNGKNAGKLVEIINGEEVRPIDISITKNVLGLLVNCIVVVSVVMYLARWYKKYPDGKVAPKGFRGALDSFLMDVEDDVIKPCVGKNYRKFTPYLLTVFIFIFINNLMGLVPIFPGGANLTGNIAVTLVLALFTAGMVNIFGTKAYWKDILWPNVPVWMKAPIPLMPIIEIFGIFTKPFALMIRLFANILAGHIIILGLVCVIFLTVSLGKAMNTGMTIVAILFMVFMNCLEMLVAYIQAYVFTMLSSVFIGMAQEEHSH